MPRIGVFGGTFDPIHVGHLVTAVDVRHSLRLDRVLLVVANDPWQKRGSVAAPAADRLAMVEAAVADVDGVEASAIEIERGGVTYTADTLATLQDADPAAELFLILGTDAAAGLNTWERGSEVARRATVVVVRRPGSEAMTPPPGWSHELLEVPRLDVSSSDLRARIAERRPVDWLVPAPAVRVARERALYGPLP